MINYHHQSLSRRLFHHHSIHTERLCDKLQSVCVLALCVCVCLCPVCLCVCVPSVWCSGSVGVSQTVGVFTPVQVTLRAVSCVCFSITEEEEEVILHFLPGTCLRPWTLRHMMTTAQRGRCDWTLGSLYTNALCAWSCLSTNHITGFYLCDITERVSALFTALIPDYRL